MALNQPSRLSRDRLKAQAALHAIPVRTANLQQYDYDKKFPVYGFGGEVGFDGFNRVSHCFPICRISQAGEAEEADGVGGILTAYSAALHNIRFSGPTLFQEVLQTAMARASQPSTQFDQRYDILVILTDGIINDMTQVRPTPSPCRPSFVALQHYHHPVR